MFKDFIKQGSAWKWGNGILILLALAAAGLEGQAAGQVQTLFAYPSARVSAFFLGAAPVMTDDHAVRIPVPGQMIRVTPKCSAFGFFCLLSALLMSRAVRQRPIRSRIAGAVMALPLAYTMTILANGGRIICAYYVHRFGRSVLPPNFQGALHQGVGIAIFLTTLIAVSIISEKLIYKGQSHE